MSDFATSVPGYPWEGVGRPHKRILEAYWSGAIDEAAFEEQIAALRAERLQTQANAGLDYVPVGDFTLYDHTLDTALMLGCVPQRFGWDGGAIGHDLYYGIARGRDGVPPLAMTKWFDSNYHYLVPELPRQFSLTENRALTDYLAGREVIGAKAQPVLLGPFTFLRLARLHGAALAARLAELTPLYAQIVRELGAAGAALVQIDEPALVT